MMAEVDNPKNYYYIYVMIKDLDLDSDYELADLTSNTSKKKLSIPRAGTGNTSEIKEKEENYEEKKEH